MFNKDSLSQSTTGKSEDAALETFLSNFQSIESFNKRHNETYKQGLMDDADLTFEEKNGRRMGLKIPSRVKRNIPTTGSQVKNSTIVIPKSRK